MRLMTCDNFNFIRSITVAASNEEEKAWWMEDLNSAISQSDVVEGKAPYLNLKSCSKCSRN